VVNQQYVLLVNLLLSQQGNPLQIHLLSQALGPHLSLLPNQQNIQPVNRQCIHLANHHLDRHLSQQQSPPHSPRAYLVGSPPLNPR
jgi:hypothetical protein